MARTLIGRLSCLIRARSWLPMIPIHETSMVKFMHLSFHAVIVIFYFSDRRPLKIENDNTSTNTLATEANIYDLSPWSSVYPWLAGSF